TRICLSRYVCGGLMDSFAISDEELNKQPKVKNGDIIYCSICKELHLVKRGINLNTGKANDNLCFVACRCRIILVGIHGHLLPQED
ncbi:unnamed protein product, partial [marine sediment metagenome]